MPDQPAALDVPGDPGCPPGRPVPGWTPRPEPEPVTLAGRYVTVVPLVSAFYADLLATTCGPDDGGLWTYRPVSMPRSLPELWMHLAGVLDRPDETTFAFLPQEGEYAGRACGIASLMSVVPAHGRAEIGGVLLGPALQRTRAATEALHLLMRYALDDLGYRRLEWKCDSHNQPSRRAAARLGLAYEGRFRDHMVLKGRNRDTDWFAVTEQEWPRVRAAHERWLDPANFDPAGRQLSVLSDLTR